MVRRLKNVKDPIERDEILWALDGQKKEEKLPVHLPAFLENTAGGKRPAPVSTSQGAPTMSPGAPPGTSAPPQMRLANILNYIVTSPVFIFRDIKHHPGH